MIRATFWALLVVGCGGNCPGAESAASAGPSEAAPVSRSESPPEKAGDGDAEAAKESSEPAAEAPKKSETAAAAAPKDEGPIVNPEFPENASVSQAIAAVPKGTPRANVDAETLAEPLQNQSVYEPCKVGTQHFKLKVAIWNGQAVGVDVTSPNKALASCIEKQVRGLSWPGKVRSLNTVEYSM
ncbi:MAG TPA: hypothetical protein VHE30_20535 [Polyangiaceae bacterium]|nr:hypothetical protein [Polyangiaceae bacterium]